MDFFNSKSCLVGGSDKYYPCRRTAVILFNWEEKGCPTFPKGISLKVNVIVGIKIIIHVSETSLLSIFIFLKQMLIQVLKHKSCNSFRMYLTV